MGAFDDQGQEKETEGGEERQYLRDQSPELAPAEVPLAAAVPVPFAFPFAGSAASSAQGDVHVFDATMT